jgi:hypothetical protein
MVQGTHLELAHFEEQGMNFELPHFEEQVTHFEPDQLAVQDLSVVHHRRPGSQFR